MDDELVDITTQRRELIIPLPTGDQAVLTYPFPMDEETFEYLGQFFNMAKRGMTLSAKTRYGYKPLVATPDRERIGTTSHSAKRTTEYYVEVK